MMCTLEMLGESIGMESSAVSSIPTRCGPEGMTATVSMTIGEGPFSRRTDARSRTSIVAAPEQCYREVALGVAVWGITLAPGLRAVFIHEPRPLPAAKPKWFL